MLFFLFFLYWTWIRRSPGLFCVWMEGRKVLNGASWFLRSGLLCILVTPTLRRPSVSTRSERQCRSKSIDSHRSMKKYRDKTSRRVKRGSWIDAFLAHASCRRIFFKKLKLKKTTTTSTTPVQPQSFRLCNLKNMTINSYPKCGAISSAAPFRNLNCPRSLFCPNSAFFAANSPWTPRINLKVKQTNKQTNKQRMEPNFLKFILSFLSVVKILKFLLSKYLKRCIFRLSVYKAEFYSTFKIRRISIKFIKV